MSCLNITLTAFLVIFVVMSGSKASPRYPHHPSVFLNNNPRIIGGKEVSISDYPYQAALFFLEANFRCGATIINSYWVLTAAHCLGFIAAEFFTIRVGSTYRNRDGLVYQAEEIVIHPEYNYRTFDLDVALMRMQTEMSINSGLSIKSIPILSAYDVLEDGQEVRISGWGFTDERFGDETILRAVVLPVVNQDTCRTQLWGSVITENMFCAGFDEGGRDSCFGDDGGPAVTMDGKLAGIVSWGQGCAEPGRPSVYVRVSNCADWIEAITRTRSTVA